MRCQFAARNGVDTGCQERTAHRPEPDRAAVSPARVASWHRLSPAVTAGNNLALPLRNAKAEGSTPFVSTMHKSRRKAKLRRGGG